MFVMVTGIMEINGSFEIFVVRIVMETRYKPYLA